MTVVERPSASTRAGVLGELAQGLRARGAAALGRAGDVALVSATVAAEPVDAIGLYAAAVAAGLEASFWSRPSTGLTLVGIGRAWSTEANGPDRFAEVAAAWAQVSTTLDGEAGDSRLAGPRLLGGLGFDGRVAEGGRCVGTVRGGLAGAAAAARGTARGRSVVDGQCVGRGHRAHRHRAGSSSGAAAARRGRAGRHAFGDYRRGRSHHRRAARPR